MRWIIIEICFWRREKDSANIQETPIKREERLSKATIGEKKEVNKNRKCTKKKYLPKSVENVNNWCGASREGRNGRVMLMNLNLRLSGSFQSSRREKESCRLKAMSRSEEYLYLALIIVRFPQKSMKCSLLHFSNTSLFSFCESR